MSGESITLRPVQETDEEFLASVNASTRADELKHVPWSQEQKDVFVRMQFAAQKRHYAPFEAGPPSLPGTHRVNGYGPVQQIKDCGVRTTSSRAGNNEHRKFSQLVVFEGVCFLGQVRARTAELQNESGGCHQRRTPRWPDGHASFVDRRKAGKIMHREKSQPHRGGFPGTVRDLERRANQARKSLPAQGMERRNNMALRHVACVVYEGLLSAPPV
jgi:hypothetical protein